MEKICLHCGSAFGTGRHSKKYCRDTCKQMAYLQRNGLVRVRGTDEIRETQELNTVNDVNNHPAVNHGSTGVNDLVFTAKKEYMKDREDENKEVVENRQCLYLLPEKTEAIEPSGEEDPDTEQTKQSATRQEPLSADEQKTSRLNTLTELAETEPAALKKLEEKELPQPSKPEIPYRQVESPFLNQLKKFSPEATELYLLHATFSHWDSTKKECIEWVNIRFRCLLEHYIRFSNYGSVDRETLRVFTNAFIALIKSRAFAHLPEEYPFKDRIRFLAQSLYDALTAHTAIEIKLRLPQEQKIQLILIRKVLAIRVAAKKFSDLNFLEDPKLFKSDDDEDKPEVNYQRKIRALKYE